MKVSVVIPAYNAARIYRRLGVLPDLRARFVRLLPRMVVAERTLGASARRYAVDRPSLRGAGGEGFR